MASQDDNSKSSWQDDKPWSEVDRIQSQGAADKAARERNEGAPHEVQVSVSGTEIASFFSWLKRLFTKNKRQNI